MKLSMVVCSAALVLSAAEIPATSPGATKARPESAAAKGLAIPAGAVATGPWSYRYTDADGKAWVYRQTPFGVMRAEDQPATPAQADRGIADVKASEDGDTVWFERPSAFGTMRWQKKKTELNEMEQAVWEREQARQRSGQD
ncbi:MAG: hypothetical protein LAP40_18325 [Acidobacteriia bacterium]|nr:hypothetical protein [Terriglobia bacterium]